jgi:hypothetical protein
MICTVRCSIRAVRAALALTLAVLLAPALAQAQGGATSSIAGTVVDTAKAVIPGATVVVTNEATGVKFDTVSSSNGDFIVPALSVGTYSVTVSLEGFKTVVIAGLRVQLGSPTTVRATLDVGNVAETITVTGAAAELINTQTATVSATLNIDQIAQIPTPTRDTLNAVTYLVGVNQIGEARGNATINGLPESFLNITLDGVSNNDNFNKSTDGFFAPVRPRQDAIEAVTVTTAAGGGDIGGHGGASINFVTRQGTNKYTGSAYEYFRDSALNTNYWFNKQQGLEKNDVQLNQFGFREGGPIVIPGLYDGHGKAFFFVHYEQLRLPNNASRTRTVLNPRALDGWFRYAVGTETREVNVLTLAGSNNQIIATDPLVMKTLNAIQSAIQTTGNVAATSDPLLNSFSWLSPANQVEHQPAIRIDYNISAKHRLSGTFNKLWQDRDPDQFNNYDHRFPGSPQYHHTVVRRPQRSIALRSTLTSSMVNEVRVGITKGEFLSFGQPASSGPQNFADLGGYALDFDQNIGLTNWFTNVNLAARSAYQYTFDETLTWQKGAHSVTFGGGVFLGRAWSDSQQQVPGINLGFNSANDPAATLFTTANFAGASAAQLADARDLYALLTGRVFSVTGQAALDPSTNKYSFLGKRRQAGSLDNYSMYVQDSWRLHPTLTLNAGVRWDVQTPFAPVNGTLSRVSPADTCGISGFGSTSQYGPCSFFTPGASGGVVPRFVQYAKGTAGYNTDWNNVAPNVGAAWRPSVERGFLRTLLGNPEDAVIRGGYSIAYNREGFGRFTGIFGANPGSTLSLTRDANTGLVPAGEQWPVLLSQTSRLYPASFNESPVYPIAIRANRADSVNAFQPDIQIPSAQSWTIGVQRSLDRNTAVEIRYVGTRGRDTWTTLNFNERNVIENGFFKEFQLAVANLTANNAAAAASSANAARAGSFAYFGPGSGTSPLPIYLAYLTGRRDADNVAAYATSLSTAWTNSALTQDMVRTNPSVANSALDLDGDLTRRTNALAAGLPANLFVVNPDAGNVNVLSSGGKSQYNALQLEVRRRLSKGLAVNGSYQYAHENLSSVPGLHYDRVMNPTADVRHAIKGQWDWAVPVGRGERIGRDMHPLLNGVIGGWRVSGATRIQAQMIDLGNVRVVGMSMDELQSIYKVDLRVNPANGLVTPYMLPDDVILNTRRAFNTSTTSVTGYSDLGVPEGRYLAPASGPDCIQVKSGDCAPRTVLVRAPFFTRVDLGLTKRFPIRGAMNFELRIDVLNLFDNVNFTPVANPGTAGSIFQVTEGYTDADNNFDPGGRLGQIAFRLNW